MKHSSPMKCLLTIPVMAYCSLALADDGSHTGTYLGARVGYSYNQQSCMEPNLKCDKDDIGYGFFGGYDFNQRWGLELSFNDIGDSKAQYTSGTFTGKLREIDLSLKLSHPLSDRSHIYGKLGAAYWDGKVSGNNVSVKDSGVRPLAGAGIGWHLSDHWTGRLEYQYIDQPGNDVMGYSDPHFLGIALLRHFGSRPAPRPAVVYEPQPAAPVEPAPTPAPQPAPEQRIVVDEQLGGPLFEFDKAEIRNTQAIDQVANILLQNTGLTVSIVGHTDSRGASEYNQRLSETRANVVANYLRSRGVAQNRIQVFGAGESQPVADNETDAGRAKNRRVEFIIIGTKTLP